VTQNCFNSFIRGLGYVQASNDYIKYGWGTKEADFAFWGFPSPVVCSKGFRACKWSAKAKIPVFSPEGVSLPHTPPPA